MLARVRTLVVAACWLGLGLSASGADDAFEQNVRPLLVKACFECHGAKKQESSLRVDSRAGLLAGGDGGPAIVPGDAEASRLIAALRHQGDVQMPPDGKLTEAEIASVAKWIGEGAPWPDGPAPAAVRNGEITAEDRAHWAFQPLARPTVPQPNDPVWRGSPVDAFLMRDLESRGLKPAPRADRYTLIRRATYDLTGLPPTLDEVNAFVADESPDAYPKLVDRLLATRAYGERWGRHWLDVVRYADTAGETADYPVADAWRYRNYVIDSIERDKPFDEFIREQISGDLMAALAPADKQDELKIATGFIAVTRRFGFDIESDQHLAIADTLDVLGQSVLGLTIGCARCHHHKYDPISSGDYYGLYGIFSSTKYSYPGCEKNKAPRDMLALAAPAVEGQPAPQAYGAVEGTPADSPIQRRGEPKLLGPIAPRKFLDILGGAPVPVETKQSGRWELAQQLTAPTNPLTPRVAVNRVWLGHFGRGLVATPNDFGRRGSPPSHPELLDYLASRFVDEGWSLKKLHRLIMLSQAYQLSGEDVPENVAGDPGNAWYWRFEPRRLSAEEIRDSLLVASGELDRTPGEGHPFPPSQQWGYTQHSPFLAVYETNRRTVYVMTQRIKKHPFLANFDGADPNASTPIRQATITPAQALFFMNDPFVHARADKLAGEALAQGPDTAARVNAITARLLSRAATADEVHEAEAFAERFQRLTASGNGDERALWGAFSRVLAASNEFMFVE